MNLYSKFIVTILLSLSVYSSFSCADPEKIKHKTSKEVLEDVPYTFKSKAAEDLSVKAFDLAEKGDYNKAIIQYNKALEIEPDNPKLYFDLSNCYMDKKQYELAILHLSQGIGYDSTYFALYNNRGLCYYQLEEDEKAIKDYEKALKLDDQNASISYNLSLAYYETNQLVKACKALDESITKGLNVYAIRDQREFKALQEICKDR